MPLYHVKVYLVKPEAKAYKLTNAFVIILAGNSRNARN